MANKKGKQRKARKWIYWVILLVLLILAMVATYLVWNTYFKKDEASQIQEPETIEEAEVVESGGTVVIKGGEEEDKKVVQYEGEDPNKAENLTGVITYAGVVGDNLMIRTSIDQFLGEGECNLVIKRNGTDIYSGTAAIVAEASTSSCQGFDVPVAALGNGAAQININLSSGGKAGTLITEVNL